MKEYYFHTESLSVGYHGVPLIRDISMNLEKGEILTLIGPNGSGKSTILKSITKHLKTLGGNVYLEEKDMHHLSYKEVATRLAVVLTERIKPELMTCWDLVSTGRYPYTGKMGILTPEDKNIIQESMARVHAYDLKDKNFSEISDGQRQRILLARAICQKPDIIVLDEPTSFLDVRHKLELLSILRDMAKEDGITVIMSLHEIDLAQKISDKVICVKGETISHYGSPSEIFCPQLIQELYEIEKGSYNICFGSVELKKPIGIPEVFVVAGGGTGIFHFRALQRYEIPFYTGVLHQNDVDFQVAQVLAHQVFFEEAFSAISDRQLKLAIAALKTCKQVLYTGVSFGPGNEKNKQLLEVAKDLRLPIVTQVEQLILEKGNRL